MGQVIRLDANDNEMVIKKLNAMADTIEELCVIVTLKDGTRKIMSGKVQDKMAWYGIVASLAHDFFLHDFSVPIQEK